MKKFLSALLLAPAILLTACDNNNIPAEIKNGTYTGIIESGQLKAEADITFTEDKCVIYFSSPDSLKGLEVSYENSETKVTLGDNAFTAGDNFPCSAAAQKFYSAVEFIRSEEEPILVSRNDKAVVTGGNENGGFSLQFDNGELSKLSCGAFTFTISDSSKGQHQNEKVENT